MAGGLTISYESTISLNHPKAFKWNRDAITLHYGSLTGTKDNT